MRPFLTILTEILNNTPNIPELTNLRQIGIPTGAEIVPGVSVLDPVFGRKFIRLHCLMLLIEESTAMPKPDIVRDIAEMTGASDTNTFLTSQRLFRDGQEKARVLTHLIIQLVRETFPAEQQRDDVMYYMRMTGPSSVDFLYAPM